MAEFCWDESWIGYLSAASVIGSLFVLTAGIGLVHRMGGVWALQVSLLLGAASLVLFTRAVDRGGAARQHRDRPEQRRRQSRGQRGAAALHAAGAPQLRVLDQAGRRSARRRDRGARHAVAGGVWGWRIGADRRRRRADRRHGGDLAAALAGSIRRATPWRPRGWSASAGPTSSCRCARCRTRRGFGACRGSAACWRWPQAVLGHLRGDLSRGGARPVAQRRRPGVRGDAGDRAWSAAC